MSRRCLLGAASVLAVLGVLTALGACSSEETGPPVGASGTPSGATTSDGGGGASSSGGGGSTSTSTGGGGDGGSSLAAAYCLEYLPPPYYDTSDNCTSEPNIDRYMGTQIISWKGHSYLFVNIGSDLSILNVDDPSAMTNAGYCNLGVPNVGDKDVDLYGFSVCEDCRFGIAVVAGGTVLFDLGDDATPSYQDHEADLTVHDVEGALTFQHGGTQYLVASGLPNECASGDATVYEFNTVTPDDLVQVACVQRPNVTTEISGGVYLGPAGDSTYLYLIDQTPRVNVYRFTTVGQSVTLEYVDHGGEQILAFRPGLALDDSTSPPLVVAASNIEGVQIFDVSDPASPQLTATISGSLNTVAVRYPFLWTGRWSFAGSSQTYDIRDPSAPVPLDPGFWDPAHDWNAFDCARSQHAAFAADGSALFLPRFSVLQTVLVSPCGSGGAGP